MNCSYRCKWCKPCRYIRRHAKNFIIKTLSVLNGISLMFWFCLIDSIVSWQPYVIMAVNVAFLSLVAYANGWFYDTKPWYDRMKEEGET